MNSQTHQTTNRQPNVRTSVRVQIEQSRLRLRNRGETQAHQTFRTSWSKSKVWTSCNNLNIGEMTISEQEETISQQANGRAKSICANKMVDEAKHFWSTVDHFQKQEKEMMKHFPINRDHFRTRKKGNELTEGKTPLVLYSNWKGTLWRANVKGETEMRGQHTSLCYDTMKKQR